MAEKMRPILGQPVIIENLGGAGGSIAVGRVARAEPDGYTIDIGQWDTHVGSIIYNLNYDLQKDFDADRADLGQSAAPGRQEEPGGQQAQRTGGLDEGASRRRQVRQPECRGGDLRPAAAAAHRHQADLHSLSRRGPGDDRPGLGPGRSPGGAGRGDAAADPRRHDQGDRQPVAAALGLDAGHSDLRRDRRAGTLHVGLVRLLGAEGHAEGRGRQAQRRDDAGAGRSGGEGEVRRTRPRRGPKEQQTPEGLAKFQQAEIDKWWPIIKAANIKGE